jgi:ABC-type transport system involved in Fe-S cluster assembly fused permease/ATPase subunit
LPFVLDDVTLDIHSGEKIGICGRTGAGKTSLIYPLFRFFFIIIFYFCKRMIELEKQLQPHVIDINTGFPVEVIYEGEEISNRKIKKNTEVIHEFPNRGRILIDGNNIANVPLYQLRKSIAIIPQDPTFFFY